MWEGFLSSPQACPRPLLFFEEQSSEPCNRSDARVAVSGKFLQISHVHWYLNGLTYGPFAADAHGNRLPPRAQWQRDLAHIAELGTNSLRLYHPPPLPFLDDAA